MHQKGRRNSHPSQQHGWNWRALFKCNKPGSEIEIQYDLTYKWNPINKMNKQAKYNQRHGNNEQTDSYQTGGGKG